MAFSSLDQAVIYTLAYTTQFKYPLTPTEIYDRLLVTVDADPQHRLLTKLPTQIQVASSIKHLLRKKIIHKQGQLLFLAGYESTVQTRDQRQANAAAKHPELTELVTLLTACPWLELVYITGSMAMNNIEMDDDIDLLVVTQPHRLWLSRLWLLWQAMRRGKRRSWQGEEKGSWCFNLWLECEQLSIFKDQASLYTAYELLQAQPIFAKHASLSLLLEVNQWAKHYVPLSAKWKTIKDPEPAWVETMIPATLGNTLLDWLNWLAYYGQLLYMKPHMTREKVGPSYAFFHPRDTQAWIYRGWQQVIEKVTQVRYG